ncbi:hypothetical protein RSAG8_04079, partial [Rhizoctonia solani AG-8 WAC10335]
MVVRVSTEKNKPPEFRWVEQVLRLKCVAGVAVLRR